MSVRNETRLTFDSCGWRVRTLVNNVGERVGLSMTDALVYLTPLEADQLAEALKKHADEARRRLSS